MIAHVVLFTPRRDLAATERQALADAFEAALRDISSIRRARVGRRVTHGRPYEQLMAVDYQYAAILEFATLADLQAYLNHPSHEQLAARFFTAFEKALMYDFDLTENPDALRTL